MVKKRDKVTKMVKSILYLGLGAAAVTNQKARQIAKELIKKGEVTKKDLEALAKEVVGEAGESRNLVDKLMSDLKESLEKLNLPTRKAIAKLKQEMEDLKEEIKKLKEKK